MTPPPPNKRAAESHPTDPSHWYALESNESVRPVSARSGKARTRRARRQTQGEQPQSGPLSRIRPTIPKLAPSHAVIAVAVVAVIGFIAFIAGFAGRSNAGNGVVSATKSPAIAAVGGTPAALPTIDVKPWDGTGRFTLLFMGLDTRPDETLRQARTDTMILLSLDPETKTAGMLSIPRDLYVPIPNEADMQKINAAYVVGELKKPGGGPEMTMRTIQYNLGIKVNAYIAVDFETVIAIVDAMGGLDIDVPFAIDDLEYPDMNYGYDPLHINAGKQHMDGVLTLKYARTRHQTSDFDRGQRQQQVLFAIRDRATKLDVLSDLLRRAPTLWTQVNDGMLTNLSLERLLSLGMYVREIPLSKVVRGAIDGDYLRAVPNATDQALTLRREKIAELMTRVFGPTYAK